MAVVSFTNIGQADTKSKKIIILGDSLTAGYGLDEKESFPVRLESALRAKNHDVVIVNAGVSGDTTAGGLERLEWVLADEADVLAIALGANDGLRGVDPKFTRDNLEKIIVGAKNKNKDMKILLIGMYAPPNLGATYVDYFNGTYPHLAKKYSLPLYPFFLEGIVTDASLNQNDGVHPNAKGVDMMVKNLLPFFEENL